MADMFDMLAAKEREKGYKAAAGTQKFYTGKAEEYINKYYGEAEEAYTPWITTGKAAQNVVADLSGANGPDAQRAAYEKFQTDPSYKFVAESVNKALERSALTKGNIFSGNFMQESGRVSSDLASQQYSSYFNRLMGISEQGRQASGDVARLKAGRGSALASAELGLGTNLANIDLGKSSSFADTVASYGGSNTISTILGAYFGGKGGGTQKKSNGDTKGGGTTDTTDTWASGSDFSNLYSGSLY